MAWNFDDVPAREGTNCIKYDLRKETFGTGDVIPMWVADMDFRTPPFITEALHKRLEHDIFGYSFRPDKYCTSISDWFHARHGWKPEKEWIVFCPGIVPALNLCTLAFTEPGDGIIVQPPVYFPFFSAAEAHGRKLKMNRLIENNGKWEMDYDSLIRLIDGSTRMIIVSNPHNPVGRAWRRHELERLLEICLENNIVIISDEIHCDLVLPGFRHVPMASLSEKAALATVTCIAPSKTFNLAGLSTSSLIIPDDRLRKAFSKVIGNLHIGSGNIFGTEASIAAYTHGAEWLDELLVYLEKNIALAEDYFRERIPEIIPVSPEATYMMWLDCRKLELDPGQMRKFFIEKAGVGMNEGSSFGPGGEGFMRMNLATTFKTVEKALDSIEKAVSSLR
ncbi:MAG: PatB family C-S lyase [Bacteroidales bacterium]|jgi:cystathionine beta-lyase|nr:PatB family C-S lyase [Bacteroidales bacterium]MCU0408088.1 PatB family C-S lyase [Bacteroidales bacterium]